MHQLLNEAEKPSGQSVVSETLAPGYMFQGQLLRGAVVAVTARQPNPTEPELALSGA